MNTPSFGTPRPGAAAEKDPVVVPRAPGLPADIADLHGAFEHGYGADDVRTVFGRISDAGGPYLVCVWDFADDHGFGGNSEFYAEADNGVLLELQPDVYRWLAGEQEDPGPLSAWTCAPVPELTEFATSDDFHNYALLEH
ncbi:hypothetical protein ACVW0K_007333 [Streptomyces filamentosus]